MRVVRVTKISWKLTLIYSGVFSLVLILLNIATIMGVKYFLIHQAVSQVEETRDLLVERIEELDGYLHELKAKDLVLEIPSNDNIYVKIIDSHGKVVNESAKYNQKIPRQIPVKVNKLKITPELLYESRQINLLHQKHAYLQVVKSLSNENKFMRVLMMSSVVAEVLGIIFSLFSGLVLSKKMLTPIMKITNTAKNISIYDLNQRIDTDGPNDELTTLAKTFNEMISRLQKSFQVQNQFVSDASHELRTPVAVIQGYANLLDRWGKTDPQVLQESLDAIKSETAQMTTMMEKMLFLARSDNGGNILQKESLALESVINEVLKETSLIAPEFEISFRYEEPLSFYGDRRLLKQMFRALIDNSIKFSFATKKIIVTLKQERQTVLITLQDFGMGISPEKLPYIFNRFYQAGEARKGGSGLGLAIVKWIVEAHLGTITAKSVLGQGTIFTVGFPVTDALKGDKILIESLQKDRQYL